MKSIYKCPSEKSGWTQFTDKPSTLIANRHHKHNCAPESNGLKNNNIKDAKAAIKVGGYARMSRCYYPTSTAK